MNKRRISSVILVLLLDMFSLALNRAYGQPRFEWAYCGVETDDGGYALAGSTLSVGAGSYDAWLIKTDSDGNTQWNKTYGAGNTDGADSVVQTGDGGYALAGGTELRITEPDQDFWLVKVDSDGNMEWNKTYGDAPDSGWVIYFLLAATILIIAVVTVVYVKRKRLQFFHR